MNKMTFVGTKYYKASFDAQIGDKCIIDVINGTCKLLNEKGEEMGVLPASPRKLMEVQTMGFPLVENRDGRVMDIFHQEFVITTIISSSMIVVEEIVEEKGGIDMEEKLINLTKDDIVQSIMQRNVPMPVVEIQQNEVLEAFQHAKEQYPIEVMAYSMKYIDFHPIVTTLLTLRAIDDLIAKRYLKNEIGGGEFDHMRAWIGIHAYFYYNYIVEEVSMKEFFTEASMQASEKFMKEEKAREECV